MEEAQILDGFSEVAFYSRGSSVLCYMECHHARSKRRSFAYVGEGLPLSGKIPQKRVDQ